MVPDEVSRDDADLEVAWTVGADPRPTCGDGAIRFIFGEKDRTPEGICRFVNNTFPFVSVLADVDDGRVRFSPEANGGTVQVVKVSDRIARLIVIPNVGSRDLRPPVEMP